MTPVFERASYFRVARNAKWLSCKKPLVKYFGLSLKLEGLSFAGVVHIDGGLGKSWQGRPGVPSVDSAGVRERARGEPLMENVSSFSDRDTVE